ncbi:glutamyl-tRNA reductase [Daejeonella rubra]|uniref:Glutamyl-tRNA reductase n=1 Tax=Daejeonella rubra TaxID=990371 RepID=A0A1G9ML83_9SPHI|nr:glutamyl-tRNA reductase [Daejeonella rubra]SDL75032.1 glutamyl-tRNA reductase [Daejeonella rubra]
MKYLKVIAFTHKQIDLKDLGKFVICNESLESSLESVRQKFDIPEIFYIGTCNRVEFVFTADQNLTNEFVRDFIQALNLPVSDEQVQAFAEQVSIYEDVDALNHLLRISCSLESLVVGEKEILAQVRKAYDTCRLAGFTGDYLRLIMNRVVKTSKEVYTNTAIARKPISVVSLAYRKLRELNMCTNSRILIIGAGETNKNISKYLKKHKYSNFTIFNRTLDNAQVLAEELGGKAYGLDALKTFKDGFDVIITCTSATEPIITNEIYNSLLNGDKSRKVIVDLAVPNDTSPEVLENNPVTFIEVHSLQEIANSNLQERYEELIFAERIIEDNIQEFKPVLKQRRVEIAMREVPVKIKEIRNTAVNNIFADEIESMDPNSREVLERVMNYMEKKYISLPMVMAKDILINNS